MTGSKLASIVRSSTAGETDDPICEDPIDKMVCPARSRFELVDWTTKWLSPTPDIPGSVGWDAVRSPSATDNEVAHELIPLVVCSHSRASQRSQHCARETVVAKATSFAHTTIIAARSLVLVRVN